MGGNIAAAQAYVADITPRDRRAGALGLVGASFALGFVFGPAIGGLLAADAVVARADALLPAVVPATAYSLPSFAAAGMSFLAVAVGFVLLEEPNRTRPAGGAGARTTAIGQFRDALASAALRPLTVAYFVVAVAFAGVQVMFIPYVADAFGYDATAAAFLLTYVGVLGAVNQGVLVGRLSRVVPSRTLVAAGSVVLGAALVAIPATGLVDRVAGGVSVGGPGWLTLPLVALLLALAALSLGNALVNVSLATLVSTSAGDAEQGAAFGVTQGASSLGRTVGPPLMAVLYTVAVASPFLAGALLLVPVAIAFGRASE
jgi:MFS family permease